MDLVYGFLLGITFGVVGLYLYGRRSSKRSKKGIVAVSVILWGILVIALFLISTLGWLGQATLSSFLYGSWVGIVIAAYQSLREINVEPKDIPGHDIDPTSTDPHNSDSDNDRVGHES